MSNSAFNIVIVGGGTAGWLTAGIISAAIKEKYAAHKFRVTLIESANIATIGVGEGTWPTMRQTLSKMGISEFDFIQKCNVSFKQGSKFVGWNTGQAGDYYYHPFSLPIDYMKTNLAEHWMLNDHGMPYAEIVTPQQVISELSLAPKQITTPEFSTVCNYGYHLDAGLFAKYLQQHCIKNLNVEHIVDDVISVNGQQGADINSIKTASNGDIEGDLFIDCTGTKSLLLGEHYQVPFISKKDVLFIDSALAVQVPYSDENTDISSTTLSTAQEAGWIWDIGLFSRKGVGYVYASKYISDDEARSQLLKYLSASHTKIDELSFRKIQFEPGHRKEFWKHNCVAIGLSAGFIEPLEASALALVEQAASMIAEQLPRSRMAMNNLEKRFNERFIYRWQRIIDFLKLHYVLSVRSDSKFWLDNRLPHTIPNSLKQLLESWQHQAPWHYDFDRCEVFPSASYQYILCGMGFKTQLDDLVLSIKAQEAAVNNYNENQRLTAKYLSGLESNRSLLNKIHSIK